MLLFVVGYLPLHWLFAVPVWDRYLLPILPLILLLVARLLATAVRALAFGAATIIPPYSRCLTVLLGGLLLLPAFAARHGRFPVGGQPTADQGAWQVAERLRDAPYGTVLYDHWYSWQWRYHLFDTGVYVSWFPNPDDAASTTWPSLAVTDCAALPSTAQFAGRWSGAAGSGRGRVHGLVAQPLPPIQTRRR